MNKFIILAIAMVSVNSLMNAAGSWGPMWVDANLQGGALQGPEMRDYPAYWNWNNYNNNNNYQYVGAWGLNNWNPDNMWTTTNQNLDNMNLFNGNNGMFTWGNQWNTDVAAPLLVGDRQ